MCIIKRYNINLNHKDTKFSGVTNPKEFAKQFQN